MVLNFIVEKYPTNPSTIFFLQNCSQPWPDPTMDDEIAFTAID